MKISKKLLAIGGGISLVVIVGVAIVLGQGAMFKGSLQSRPTGNNLSTITNVNTSLLAPAQTNLDTKITQVKNDAGDKTYNLMVDQSVFKAFGKDDSGALTLNPQALIEKNYNKLYIKLEEQIPIQQIVLPEKETLEMVNTIITPPVNQEVFKPDDIMVVNPVDQNASSLTENIITEIAAPVTKTDMGIRDVVTSPAENTGDISTILVTPTTETLATPATAITTTTTSTTRTPGAATLTAPSTSTSTMTAPIGTIAAPAVKELSSSLPVAHAAIANRLDTTTAAANLGVMTARQKVITLEDPGSDNIVTIDLTTPLSNGAYLFRIESLGISIPLTVAIPDQPVDYSVVECDEITKFTFHPASLTYKDGELNSKMIAAIGALNGTTPVAKMDKICDASLANLGVKDGFTIRLSESNAPATFVTAAVSTQSILPSRINNSYLNGFVTYDPTHQSFSFDFTKEDVGFPKGVALKKGTTYNFEILKTQSTETTPFSAQKSLPTKPDVVSTILTLKHETAGLSLPEAAGDEAAAQAAAAQASAAQAAAAEAAAAEAAAAQAAAAQAAAAEAAAAQAAAAQAAAAQAAAAKVPTTYNYSYNYYTSPDQTAVATTATKPSTSPCVVGDKTFYLAGGPNDQYCKDLQTLVNKNENKATIFTQDQPATTPQVRYTTALAALRILKEFGASIRTRNLSTEWYTNLEDGDEIAIASAQELKDFQTVYASGILQGRLNSTTGARTLAPASKVSYIELLAMFKQAITNSLGIQLEINEANLPAFIVKKYHQYTDWKWIAEAYSFGVQYGLISKNEFNEETLFNYATRADMVRFLARFKDSVEANPELVK